MQTPTISIVFFLLASVLGAMGQFLYKSGAETSGGSLSSYLFNPRIVAGVACYIAVMVLFVAAFKKGGSLAVLYPVYATTFIFAAFIGLVAYNAPIKPINFAGMATLILGMYWMGR